MVAEGDPICYIILQKMENSLFEAVKLFETGYNNSQISRNTGYPRQFIIKIRKTGSTTRVEVSILHSSFVSIYSKKSNKSGN